MSEDFRKKLKDQLFKADCDLFWLAAELHKMSDEEVEAALKQFGQRYVNLFGIVVENIKKGG